MVLSLRYWTGDIGWADSPLHPTGLSGIKRSQPFCWKMDVWGSPRTLPCLPQALILWVLEKSLDRGKYKQIKTSGDCSQQLYFGTMSQTTALTLWGRYLLGSLLTRRKPKGTRTSYLHQLVEDGSRGEGQCQHLAAQSGFGEVGHQHQVSSFGEGEDTNSPIRVIKGTSPCPKFPCHFLILWVPGKRTQICYHIPTVSVGVVGCHIAPRACCWQGRHGRMERGILTPCQKPISAYQGTIWYQGKYGVSWWGETLYGQNGNKWK